MVNRKVFHPSYPGAVLTMSFDDGDPVAAFIQNMGEGLSQKEWDAFVQEIRVRLNRELGKVFSGTISPDQFGDAIYQHLLGAHSVSVAAGRQKAGVLGMLSDEDKQVGFFHATQQGQFIDGYVKRIKEKAARYWDEEKGEWKKGVMNRDLQMYASRLRGTASIAFEAYSPDDAQFNWKLGIAEHCEDCINLAADSPHMKGELPVFPGDGGTDCKTNCKCHLVRDDGVACYRPDPGVGRWSEGDGETSPSKPGDAEVGDDAVAESRPVSSAISYEGGTSKSNDSIRVAMKVIDGVHADGALPEVRAGDIRTRGNDALGWYHASEDTEKAIGLKVGILSVRGDIQNREFVAIHEAGHMIENEIFGRGSIVLGKAPDHWKLAGSLLDKSPTVAKLREELAELEILYKLTKDDRWQVLIKHVEYLLRPQEIWARGYSQFIAIMTTRRLIRNQLKKEIADDKLRGLDTMWPEDEFEPIAAAIMSAMVHEGWIEQAAAEKA